MIAVLTCTCRSHGGGNAKNPAFSRARGSLYLLYLPIYIYLYIVVVLPCAVQRIEILASTWVRWVQCRLFLLKQGFNLYPLVGTKSHLVGTEL